MITRQIRFGLPETNSSSTHSLILSQRAIKRSKEEILDELGNFIKNGVLTVTGTSFGWEQEKYNDTYTKIQYTAAQICAGQDPSEYTDCPEETPRRYEKTLSYLGELIRDYLGLKKVVFEFLDENKIWPEIDHQSRDLYFEILESRESMLSFIFNDYSWLFTSNDNSSEPPGFFETTKKERVYSTITVKLPDPIGSVEVFGLRGPTMNLEDILTDTRGRLILDLIVYDPRTGKFIKNPDENNIKKYMTCSYYPVEVDGHWYLPWVSNRDYISPEVSRWDIYGGGGFRERDIDGLIKVVRELVRAGIMATWKFKIVDLEIQSEELGKIQ